MKRGQNTLFNGNRGSLSPIADLELLQYPIDMVTHGELANPERLPDRLIGKPLGEQLQDFTVTWVSLPGASRRRLPMGMA
jgi:hypothetical protein